MEYGLSQNIWELSEHFLMLTLFYVALFRKINFSILIKLKHSISKTISFGIFGGDIVKFSTFQLPIYLKQNSSHVQ